MQGDHYQPPVKQWWRGRADSMPQERIFQCVELIDINDAFAWNCGGPAIGLIGFCSDTGIEKNSGRLGARNGPYAFRHCLGNLSVPYKGSPWLYDLGNVHCDNGDLAAAQNELSEIVAWALRHRLKPVIIGGGHEVSFGGYKGAVQESAESIGIINFDAHFDLRPLGPRGGNSGTAFTQMAILCQERGQEFSYLVMGLQPASNTESLFAAAKSLNASYITAADIHQQRAQHVDSQLENFLQHHRSIYLTICLDVFAQAFAPGVSAPQALGLYPAQVIPLIKKIIDSNKLICLDIAELSPPLDEGEKTARLCAALAHAAFDFILNRAS